MFFSRNRHQMSDQQSHSDALEASLNAARREADALREQIQIFDRRRNSTNAITSNALTSNALTSNPMMTSNVQKSGQQSLDPNMDSAWATLLSQVSSNFDFLSPLMQGNAQRVKREGKGTVKHCF